MGVPHWVRRSLEQHHLLKEDAHFQSPNWLRLCRAVYYHHDKFGNLKMVGDAEFPHKDFRHSSLKEKVVPDEFRY